MSNDWRAHFAAPAGAGRPDSQGFAHGRAGAIKVGTVVEFWLRSEDGCVEELRFEVFGCPAAIAAASWVCEHLRGRRLQEARTLTGVEIARALALPPEKRSVALVVEDALKDAIAPGAQ